MAIGLLLASAALSQSNLTCSGPYNSASWQSGLPGGGGLATVFCSGTWRVGGPTSYVADPAQPLPYELGGVQVTVGAGAGGVAPLLAVVYTGNPPQQYVQVNFQVPIERNSTLASNVDDKTPLSISLGGELVDLKQSGSGGFFTNASGYALAKHASDGTWVTPENPAHAGEEIVAYADDFFLVWPPPPVGYVVPEQPVFRYRAMLVFDNNLYLQDPPASLSTPAGLPGTFANTPAVKVTFEGLAAGQIGVEQINFVVPDTQKPGDWALFFNRGTCPDTGKICGAIGASSAYVKLPVR